ncbi:MAG: universal stress protein [Cyclobacteriaceae bacterium]
MMKKTQYEPYKVALVGLDLTEMDDHIIRQAATMCKMLALERIFFVHVAKDLQLPDELIAKYPGLVDPLDESIETDIMTKVEKYFIEMDVGISIIVKEGHPIDKILKLSKVKNVDLIILGRKKNLDGSGIVSSKIARNCPCSILFVTRDSPVAIDKILVPVDFSEHSALAIQLALHIQENTSIKLQLVHIYGVPIGYYKTGKSLQEFAAIMKTYAEKDHQKFLAKYHFPLNTSCEYLLTDNGHYPELTYSYAEKNDTDLIIMGSQGRTGIASILMGSVAEKLVYLDSDIPILIIKEKGENMGFFDALMKL